MQPLTLAFSRKRGEGIFMAHPASSARRRQLGLSLRSPSGDRAGPKRRLATVIVADGAAPGRSIADDHSCDTPEPRAAVNLRREATASAALAYGEARLTASTDQAGAGCLLAGGPTERAHASRSATTPPRISNAAPARAPRNGSPRKATPMIAANTTEHSRNAATAPMDACVIAQTTIA